jgi:hypothetical protein
MHAMISEQGKDLALLSQNQREHVMPLLAELNKKVIVGNGKPPLCTTVALLEADFAGHMEEHKAKKDDGWRWTDTLLSAGMLIVTLVAVFK